MVLTPDIDLNTSSNLELVGWFWWYEANVFAALLRLLGSAANISKHGRTSRLQSPWPWHAGTCSYQHWEHTSASHRYLDPLTASKHSLQLSNNHTFTLIQRTHKSRTCWPRFSKLYLQMLKAKYPLQHRVFGAIRVPMVCMPVYGSTGCCHGVWLYVCLAVCWQMSNSSQCVDLARCNVAMGRQGLSSSFA